MTLIALTFPLTRDRLFEAMEAFEEALSVSGYEDKESGAWFAELHFETLEEAEAAAEKAADIFSVETNVAPLPDINWLEKVLEDLPVVRAGRFVIYGSHHTANLKPGEIGLRIDAGEAFGTGHHGTTRGCLLALEGLLKKFRPLTALDLGCGTGILAAGLAKLAPTAIVATDIDPVAIRVGRKVARDNGLTPRLRFDVGPGFETRRVREHGPFDLIIANILARPLVALSPKMHHHLHPGGRVILSGLLIEQERRVLNSYLDQGFRLERRIHLDEWSTLVLNL